MTKNPAFNKPLNHQQRLTCLNCQQMAYQSQREAPDDRASRKANKIRDKLGWEHGILNPSGQKPKGMHWKTYFRLLSKHNDYSNQALMQVAEKLGIINNKLSTRKRIRL